MGGGSITQDVVEGLQSVSQGFGCTDYMGEWAVTWCPHGRFHSGIDLAAYLGQPVHTTRSGVISAVGINYLGPYAVGIHTDQGPFLVFGHLDTATVKVGDPVRAGQVIGTCGTRGNSSGPHVHFAVRTDTATEDVWSNRADTRILDPTPYLTLKEEDVTPEKEAQLFQQLSEIHAAVVENNYGALGNLRPDIDAIKSAVTNASPGQALPQDVQDALKVIANHLK